MPFHPVIIKIILKLQTIDNLIKVWLMHGYSIRLPEYKHLLSGQPNTSNPMQSGFCLMMFDIEIKLRSK